MARDNTRDTPCLVETLSMEDLDLPASATTRWVARRKAAVVAAVRNGLISLDEACARYRLSREEFESWERLIDGHGTRALRVTRLKAYRR